MAHAPVSRDRLVEVVAAEGRVAVGREDLEDPARELQDRYVEGAAAEIEDREGALGSVIETVRDGGGGGLVQQAQHVQARELRRVLRRLALRIVEIRGH